MPTSRIEGSRRRPHTRCELADGRPVRRAELFGACATAGADTDEARLIEHRHDREVFERPKAVENRCVRFGVIPDPRGAEDSV